MDKGKKAVKTVGFMVIATLLAKIFGMLREMFFAGQYGSGIETSAYFNASRIPILFFDLTLGAAILSTFIPVFNGYLEKNNEKRAIEFSNNFLNLVLLISIVFSVLGIIFNSVLVDIIAPGLPLEVKELTAKLLIILLPTTIFTAVAYSIVGILQSYGEFNIPAIISLISNFAVIVYLLFFNKYFGIFGMAFAMLIGWSLQVFIQIPSLIKKGYKYKFTLNIKDEGIREVFKLAVPILVTSWLQPLCVAINMRFASFLADGVQVISGLEYANRLYIILVGVFTFAITNYIFPALSRFSGGGNVEEFAKTTKTSIKSMLLIIAPIMVGMMALSREIITIVYERGKFTPVSTDYASTALFYFSIAMLAFGFNEIANKTFFAMKKVKIPMIASLTGICITGICSFISTKVFDFGIIGLASSASIGTIIVAIIMAVSMWKNIKGVFDKNMMFFILKVLIISVIMGICVYMTKGIFTNLYVKTITCVICGIGVYGIGFWFIRKDVK